MRYPVLMAVALPVCAAQIATAQSIYIDFGATTGAPSSSFAGATGAPGVWNLHNAQEGLVTSLLNTGGVATGVSLTVSALGSTGATGGLQGLTGDNAAMLGDYMFGTFNDLTLEFAGLAPGQYRVVTYAIGRQSSAIVDTEVWLQGDTATTQIVTGEWAGDFALGQTHTIHTLDLADDLLRIDLVRPADAILNGVQLILVPAPGAATLLLAAALAPLRRRKR